MNDVEFEKADSPCAVHAAGEAAGLFEAIRKDAGRHPARCAGASWLRWRMSSALDIDEWVRPISKGVQKVGPVPGAECEVRFCPVGVALVVGTWNFPMPLILKPLVSAIAAGNPVLVKFSEISEHTSQLLGSLLEEYLDPRVIAVVHGGIPQATETLKPATSSHR